MQHTRNKSLPWLCAFGASAITGLLFIVPFFIKNGGIFYLGSDFVEQQIPFWTYCNEAIKTGNIFWTASDDLGTSFLGAFSFYAIGSPFFWLSLLLPSAVIPQAMGFLLAFKMGISGLTSFAWLRRTLPRHSVMPALICSVVYTFCGYSISNMNFHFFDVTALFPLLLLTLDLTVQENRRGLFTLSVALMAFTNTVFFAGEVVFLVLYFLVRVWCKNYKITCKKFLQLAVESLLGVGMAAVLVLPSVLSLLSNPRVSARFDSLFSMLVLKPIYWAEIIRSLLFPAECIFDRGFYLQGFTNGAELYLPLFGVVLFVAYCVHNRKSWLTRLLAVCALFAVIPILNSAFVMFNAEYYTRWYFMPILVLCAASACVLEDRTLSLKPGIIAYGVLWGLLGLVGLLFTYYFKVTFIYNLVPVVFFVAVSLGGFVCTLLIRHLQKWRGGMALLLVAVMLCSAATGAFNTYYHSRTRGADAIHSYYSAPSQISLPASEQGYRIWSDYYFMNLGTVLNAPTVTTFSSSINGSIFDFYEAMDIPRTVISRPTADDRALLSFLSVKYHIALSGYAELYGPDYTQTTQQGDYTVAECAWYVPMGFVANKYILQSEFETLTTPEKEAALLHALVITDEQAERLAPLLEKAELPSVIDTQDDALTAAAATLRSTAAETFTYTNTGATAQITLSEDSLVLFTIPWDEGFTVKVNGETVVPEKADYSFYAVPCSAGSNTITFTYMPRGLHIGLIISSLSLVLFAAWLLFCRRNAQTSCSAASTSTEE